MPVVRFPLPLAILLSLLSGCNQDPVTPRERAELAQENLEEAREEAAELIAESEEEAVEILADAKEEAIAERRDANRKAQQMVDEAKQALDHQLNLLSEPEPVTAPTAEPVETLPNETVREEPVGPTAVEPNEVAP